MKTLHELQTERKSAGSIRAMVGLLAGAVVAFGATSALAQSGNSPSSNQPAKQQQENPFAVKQPKARELPSILERDADGKVIWIEGDPARKAIEVMTLSIGDQRLLREILAERDAQLLRAAVPNTDKVVRALQAERENTTVQFDAFGRHLMGSLGAFGRRGAFNVDSKVRESVSRAVVSDLSAVMREYNLARVDDERKMLEAYYKAQGEQVSEVMLRDSTILQRFQQRDVAVDAGKMLKERFGGDEVLAEAHPELADTIASEGYWAAMSKLTNSELAKFVLDQTGVEVHFPSPEGDEALAPLARQALEQQQQQQADPAPVGPPQGNGNAPAQKPDQKPGQDQIQPQGQNQGQGQGNSPRQRPKVSPQADVQRDADGKFSYTDEELEVLRVNASSEPAILRRDDEGRAIRLDGVSFVEAYKAMRDAGLVSQQEIEEFEVILEDRDKIFDEQALRLYEYLIKTAANGPVEEAPLHEAVLNEDWEYWGRMYGAWLNEKLPAPSTVHNDMRVREALQWDNLVQMSRIANDYDGGHIFDARIELLKMVRDRDDMDDSAVALPGNIKRPWRLQQIIRDAKASYARQLKVTDPNFRQALASLDLEGEVAEEIEKLAAADGPMTEADFWEIAVKLPLEAHRELIKARTGYEAPEPGFFEGKFPSPTTGAPSEN